MMFLGIRKKYWGYFGIALGLIAIIAFAKISPLFAVGGAEIIGPYSDCLDKTSLEWTKEGKNLFDADRKKMAEQAMKNGKIGNIALGFELPNQIVARVNYFEPVALLLSGGLYGIDEHCRLIPYDTLWNDVDFPVLTGIKPGRIFDAPHDYRIAQVIDALTVLRDDKENLFARIAEINFSDEKYLHIYVTTGDETYLAICDGLLEQLLKIEIMSPVAGEDGKACYNLQYDGVVIKVD